MIKIGIVGPRGLATVEGFRSFEDVEITAFCDINEEILNNCAAAYNIPKKYRVYEDMLESDIDAVLIASPMQCHVPQAIQAIEAGKHVMSEVTAGVTMDELWWLLETVEKHDRIYMFAENVCYMPEMQIISGLVKAGKFGEVYYGEGEYLHGIPSLAYRPDGRSTWRRFWQFGKRGNFYPTHSIGPLMQWFGEDRIKSVCCFGSGRHLHMDFRANDTTVTICQLESGKLIKLRLDCMSPRPQAGCYFQLQGTKGVYEASRGGGDAGKIWLTETGEDRENAKWRSPSEYSDYLSERYKNATPEQLNASHNGSDFFIAHDFVTAIKTNVQPELDVYKACEWTAVALLSELSVTNGGRIMDMPRFRKNMPLEEQVIKL